METRKIGSLQVSLVGLGCNNFGRIDEKQTAAVVHAALDAGVNFFDTADIYGRTKSEEYLGRILGERRNEIVLATKFGMKVDENRRGAKPDYVKRALEDSLQRLRTDRIDLYQLHTPDPTVPIADTLGVLNEFISQGKVREIGCSNFSVAQLREAEAAVPPGGQRFVSVQNEFSMLHREPERGVLPECERLGLAFLPFFPLASGLLTGKYRRGVPAPEGSRIASGWHAELLTDANIDIVEDLISFAEARGRTLLELAFSWLASHKVVASVIAGATKPEQVQKNAGAASWKLTAEELVEIDQLLAAAGK